MAVIQITVAMAIIPLGFYLFVWGVDRQDMFIQLLAAVTLVIGMSSWYASLRNIKKEQEKDRGEREKLMLLIGDIASGIKGVRTDLRGLRKELKGKDGHNNANK